MTPQSYRTILTDPPWRYDSGPGRRGSSDKHYQTMTVEQILEHGKQWLPYLSHPGGSALWLWITNPFLIEGVPQMLMQEWGYRIVSMVSWTKVKIDWDKEVSGNDELLIPMWRTLRRIVREGDSINAVKQSMSLLKDFLPLVVRAYSGQGRWLRSSTEHLFLGIRGEMVPPEGLPAIPNTLPVWRTPEHSAKPLEQYPLIETVTPGPYIEMFARSRYHGWDATGLEYVDAREQ